jgi:hypothetical protein
MKGHDSPGVNPKSVDAEQLLGHFPNPTSRAASFKLAASPGLALVKILVEPGAPRRLISIVLFAVLLLCIVRGEANQPHLIMGLDTMMRSLRIFVHGIRRRAYCENGVVVTAKCFNICVIFMHLPTIKKKANR